MKVVPIVKKVRDLTRGREVVKSDNERRDQRWLRWLTLAILFLLTVLIVSPTVWDPPVRVIAGQEIRDPIFAEVDFQYQPDEAEELWRARAEREHTRVFNYDSGVRENHIGRMRRTFAIAEELGSAGPIDVSDFRARLRAIEPDFSTWENADLELLAVLILDRRFQNRVVPIIDEAYSNDFLLISRDWAIYDSNRQFVRVDYTALPPEPESRPRRYPEDTNNFLRFVIPRRLTTVLSDRLPAQTEEGFRATELLESAPGRVTYRYLRLFVRSNTSFDARATESSLENFPREDPIRVERGTLIAPADSLATTEFGSGFTHVITESEAQVLRAYRTELNKARVLRFIAEVIFVFIAFLIVTFFFIKFSRELEFTNKTVLLLGLPVLLALILGRVFLQIAGNDPGSYAGYAFPAGLIGILGVSLLDARMAVLLVTWGCILFGLEADLRYEFVIVGLFGGYTGVAALFTFRERREVLYAGLLIGLVNAATILVLHWMGGLGDDPVTAATIGALAGVACALVSFAVLPVFEVVFGITTDMRLLELTGLQHPLLKEMEEKAPGTLQHTMNVAKLAESAAGAIGSNVLLVRAGVYFHDIGKMSKPEYFTENQMTAEDKRRHEELRPQMSTLIIRNHVKEGVELAKQHKLPSIVRDFIPEHHGTSLIAYFYHKANAAYQRGEIKEPVREEDYRYPGPKPQTIETAIVMLADTVEATVTAKLSGRSVGDDELRQIVHGSILDKFTDGQFDNCNLTLKELNIIEESFVKTLRSRFHQRIDYPTQKKEAMRKDGTGVNTTPMPNDGRMDEREARKKALRTTGTKVEKIKE